LIVASCGSPPASKAPSPKPPAENITAPDAPPAARHAKKQREWARRPAPAMVATPMKGEPAPSTLGETRLVATTCEKASNEQIEATLKQMRAAVDASFDEWRKAQPDCWEQAREEYRWRHELEMQQRQTRPSGGVPRPMPSSVAADPLSNAYGRGDTGGSAAPASRPPSKASKPGEPAKAASASGTNNQVVGVDEADIVKTDGRYVYLASNGALRIVEALKPHIVSVTKLASNVREMFIEGDRAVVYTTTGTSRGARCTYGYDCQFGGDGTATQIVVLDITDRANPKPVREIDLSGSLIAARRIGTTIHTVVADGETAQPPFETWPADLETCGTLENVVRQKFARMKAENEKKIRAKTTSFPTMKENGKEQPMCSGLLRTAIRDGETFTSVVSFDLADAKSAPTTSTLQSRPGAVFASANALYLSVVHQKQNANGRWYSFYPSQDEASEIHKFRIGASPKETKYVGTGIVPGHVLNQFSMDEWYGYLRIATTRGHVPDPKVESSVSILAETDGGNLARVGAIEHIAPGEDIRSVRFDDDRGYVVTFKKTDPLFVMDLYEPQKPRILGELKIPGFSTYMHRIDPEHLLSIGFDANDHGSFAYFDGVILQLFDVKNPTDPKLVWKEKIGTRGSSSQAATDHLAFNYFAEQGLLAIPMTLCEGGGDGRNGTLLSFSGLLVYDVDLEKGFTRLGGIDHGTKGVNCNTWWSQANSAVKRSVFLDDLVYSIATDRVKVQRMDHFGEDIADLSLVP
jgi:uncharacterized secreted protein with C-terminal beta-propeller domain